MAILLDGRIAAKAVQQQLIQEVQARKEAGHAVPHLAIIQIGEDPASQTYVHHKVKACKEVGFHSTLIQQPTIKKSALIERIQQLNDDTNIDGLIIQLPLPSSLHSEEIIQHIKPEKDVDGLHPYNYGRLACHLPTHIPATPLGILSLLKHYKIPTSGKHCVIVGRSRIVGAPMSILMSRPANPGNATVTLCHSKTTHLPQFCQQADLLIVAIGQPNLITEEMVKEGAVVIDVGITRVPDDSKKTGYRLTGDVDFNEVQKKCSFITPVPGGVGPMTIASLLSNTLRAAKKEVYTISQ